MGQCMGSTELLQGYGSGAKQGEQRGAARLRVRAMHGKQKGAGKPWGDARGAARCCKGLEQCTGSSKVLEQCTGSTKVLHEGAGAMHGEHLGAARHQGRDN